MYKGILVRAFRSMYILIESFIATKRKKTEEILLVFNVVDLWKKMYILHHYNMVSSGGLAPVCFPVTQLKCCFFVTPACSTLKSAVYEIDRANLDFCLLVTSAYKKVVLQGSDANAGWNKI
ncbi:hypothetical protein GDO78_012756 [Eleutherodactylus coqui]|uniref:Uncharacterized protein n=1 Tax=Eleutherodactylus coqui TaxID=57060 RepID=A0A8J6F328_ELECQ|nr:hypothetical protein GDO78_012756 [Eleutherodactylus coqui]